MGDLLTLVSLDAGALVSHREPVELTIRDHGPGVPGGDAEVVFERFSRAEGQRAVTGTGLGLAIVRELVALGGGEVAHTEAHPGARLTVRLPSAPSQPTGQPRREETSVAEAPRGGPGRRGLSV